MRHLHYFLIKEKNEHKNVEKLLLTLGRTQFSVEKPKTVTTLTPYLEQSLTNSLILCAPALSPSSTVNPPPWPTSSARPRTKPRVPALAPAEDPQEVESPAILFLCCSMATTEKEEEKNSLKHLLNTCFSLVM